MTKRRMFLRVAAASVVALGVLVVPALADELIGVLTKIDVEGKKITVVEKDTDKEVVVKITDETETVSKKGNQKVDLEKLDGFLSKVKEKGKKGIPITVTHEKGVASKLKMAGKKGAPKKDQDKEKDKGQD